MPRTLSQLYKKIPEILEEYDNELSPSVRCSVARQLEHLQGVEDQITLIEQELSRWAKTQPACQRVHESPRSGIDDGDLPCGVSGEWATISFSETICCLVGIGCRESSQVAVSRDWAESAKEVTAISVSSGPWCAGSCSRY
ncbi:putative transposase for [Yersinia enterocolitica]|nr:putative transposase for [Yersinia enterocolitica]